MKQMNIVPGGAIEINYKTPTLSKVAETLKPTIFEDDHSYCCVFGPDLKYGIKGFGHTPEEALEDWETSLHKRLQHPFENDKLVELILSSLKQESYNQAS